MKQDKIYNNLKNVLIQSYATKKLKNKDILEICKLKNTFWKWSLKKQIKWYKLFVKKNDLNNLLIFNGMLVGYNLLRNRNAFQGKKKISYFYLDTFIINKKYRKKGFGEVLIKLNNHIIKKSSKHSFLICPKKTISFYKKYGWEKLKDKDFVIKDHHSFWHNKSNPSQGMTYRLNKNSKQVINYFINPLQNRTKQNKIS